ncbi:EF-P lysine aminoacylase GenX [Saccharospirillum sp. MSK14-1]|uniref:EF-P lysine aminoacylase EpmA n=1 Tax=Saccharospirillum sp. MSK14-1 TaxID=1897632 RepID=UPI000D33C089|nr:EF-P lysine aminoacylase EpmA [Saccharospirillum sp. MSK14-1]PTY38620.1 EF-P lysine aminoacylase GenX [Saccharospirillum sp. MSK14-1]
MTDWQPTASLKNLRRRAQLLADMRAFFAAREVLEVDTPVLSNAGVTDVNLTNIRTHDGGFLQTSPEYAMKRLLAAGIGDCYQLGHVFRQDESGARHNAEFTLLEWYRLGWDDTQLMDEVAQLCREVSGQPELPVERLSYREAFTRTGLPDPHRADLTALRAAAHQHLAADSHDWQRDDCLDALMVLVVEPALPAEQLTFITHYPASQAALAQFETEGDVTLARRFEAYWGGLELANGYFELTDAEEQQRRFVEDQQRRNAQGLPEAEMDRRLLAAMHSGLPDCAGVALGVDRLLMRILGEDHIAAVLPFDRERA